MEMPGNEEEDEQLVYEDPTQAQEAAIAAGMDDMDEQDQM